jgi:hypothetical protein
LIVDFLLLVDCIYTKARFAGCKSIPQYHNPKYDQNRRCPAKPEVCYFPDSYVQLASLDLVEVSVTKRYWTCGLTEVLNDCPALAGLLCTQNIIKLMHNTYSPATEKKALRLHTK